ncbi:MAG TPA: metallophosphoesterase [Candidatus Saccharimonadales bacterium]|nr:metallophosphoesterase [Candidatus Saccharimonadales bacterium]
MKIGIISDTHDRAAGIDGAFEVFTAQNVALVLHCGDWAKPDTAAYFADKAGQAGIPATGVLGNNDREVAAFLELAKQQKDLQLHEGILRLELAGRRIAAYHGHHKPTLNNLLVEDMDLLCLGHSHKPRYDRLDNKVVINPGSTAFAIPRSRTWRASVAVYDTGTHEAEFIYF